MVSRPGRTLKLPLQPNDLDIRDAFFDELNKLASKDRNVLLLTDDQDAFSLRWYRENLPEQYFNVGIAEQNLISLAAGLALQGKIPFAFGIATFMTMRCFEQIRDDLCCMELPVTIVASGAGFTYGGDGPTHHAVQDVAIMRSLPGMTILNPADATCTAESARIAYREPGPTYVRIERGSMDRIYEDGHDFSAGLELLLEGSEVLIVTTGIMVHQALKVADTLSRQSIKAGVLDVYRLKPVDGESLAAAVAGFPRIAVLEEHSVIGGLGSLVLETLSDYQRPIPIKRFGIPDRFVYRYGNREWMRSQVGLDLPSIVSGIRQWILEDR